MQEGTLQPWVHGQGQGRQPEAGGLSACSPCCPDLGNSSSELCASLLGPACPYNSAVAWGLAWRVCLQPVSCLPTWHRCAHTHIRTHKSRLSHSLAQEALQPQGHCPVTLSMGCLMATCGCGRGCRPPPNNGAAPTDQASVQSVVFCLGGLPTPVKNLLSGPFPTGLLPSPVVAPGGKGRWRKEKVPPPSFTAVQASSTYIQ